LLIKQNELISRLGRDTELPPDDDEAQEEESGNELDQIAQLRLACDAMAKQLKRLSRRVRRSVK
jgi:hypothetical protein